MGRAAAFKSDRETTEDEQSLGRLVTETTNANISMLAQLFDENPIISYADLKELTSLSRKTFDRII